MKSIILLATFWASIFRTYGESILTEFQLDPSVATLFDPFRLQIEKQPMGPAKKHLTDSDKTPWLPVKQ